MPVFDGCKTSLTLFLCEYQRPLFGGSKGNKRGKRYAGLHTSATPPSAEFLHAFRMPVRFAGNIASTTKDYHPLKTAKQSFYRKYAERKT